MSIVRSLSLGMTTVITSCISEAERYEKTIYRGNRKLDASGTGHRNQQQKLTKTTPQDEWNRVICMAAETSPPSLKLYTEQLTMLENVPRKEKQFRNFTVNSLRLRGPSGEKIKSDLWGLLVKMREENKQRKAECVKINKEKKPTSQKDEFPDSSEKSISRAISDDEPSCNRNGKSSALELPSEKVVTRAMKKALKKLPNRQLKFKYLRKEVQEILSYRASEGGKKKWKRLLVKCVDSSSNKLVMSGKSVTLTK